MAIYEITMPALGMAQTEGLIVDWLKNIGDKIEKDDSILQIETDKAVEDISSPVKGVLIDILATAGASIPVGNIIGKIEQDESLVDFESLKQKSQETAAQAPVNKEDSSSNTQSKNEVPDTVPEKTLEKAPDATLEKDAKPSAKKALPRVAQKTNNFSDEKTTLILASPLAKAIAQEHNLSLSRLAQNKNFTQPYQSQDVLDYLSNKNNEIQNIPMSFLSKVNLENFFKLLEWSTKHMPDKWNGAKLFSKIVASIVKQNKIFLEIFSTDDLINIKTDSFVSLIYEELFLCDIMHSNNETFQEDSDFYNISIDYIEHPNISAFTDNQTSGFRIGLIANKEEKTGNLLLSISDETIDKKNMFLILNTLIETIENPMVLLG